jgi:hypothetical protein
MSRRLFLGLAASFITLLASNPPQALGAAQGYRVSGPFVHENLAIYLVHGTSVGTSAVPLTLAEALSKDAVRVHETGSVQELAIENLGNEEIFVQSGDIVKGGQQDRVLTVSLILPPRSGRVPIASFCVEKGRWAARGIENVKLFSSAETTLPSRKAKIAIRAPSASSAGGSVVAARQTAVWDDVARVQRELARNLKAPVAAVQSPSSLQLALENETLKAAQAAYVTALQSAAEKDGDVIGYAFAINGKLNSAEIYPSNGLFRKLWAKLLRANATEAIGDKGGSSAALPSTEAVLAFLAQSERGNTTEKPLGKNLRLKTREAEKTFYFETRRTAGGFVHRSYLAK